MCGIVGIWNINKDPVNPITLREFTDSLTHRGPDSRGEFFDSKTCIGLGHRRLTIIDKKNRSNQPFHCTRNRYVLSFNGEIYNFLELRNELKSLGYSFETDSDTEVLLQSYIAWGSDCQYKFNGMWAFAIWDRALRTLFLSRDRFGVKPLYYWHTQERFAFASEQKAFLAIPEFRFEFDDGMLSHSLCQWSYQEGTDYSILQGVMKLPAGHSLTLKSGSYCKINRWWNTLDHLDETLFEKPSKDLIDQFKHLFFDSVSLRMRSDVPLGMALSGGLDSSAVASTMKQIASSDQSGSERMANSWQNAFVATFPNSPQDETHYAKTVIDDLECRGFYYDLSFTDLEEHLESFIFSMEDITDYFGNVWHLYKMMKQNGVSVSLDGHGGDELLGGYHHHPLVMLKDWFRVHPERPSIKNLLAIHESLAGTPLSPKLFKSKLGNRPRESIQGTHPLLTHSPQPFHYPRHSQDLTKLNDKESFFQSLYFEFHNSSLPTILRNFDRLSMANGVEIRSPFLDWRLVCFCFSLPAWAKINASGTKQILRESMQGIMPESVRSRKRKLGFVSPFNVWLEQGLHKNLSRIVSDHSFKQSSLFDGKKTKSIFDEAAKQKDWNTIHRIWPFMQAHFLGLAFANKRTEHMKAHGK